MDGRVYLDWNATAPLRPEARAAMIAAMDAVGNPSSVHAEGRAARAVLERARAQVARAFGAEGAEIVFTSGATEAAAMALAGRGLASAPVEHDCVAAWTTGDLAVGPDGAVAVLDPAATALQAANSETGVTQDPPAGLAFIDAAQIAGKAPFAFDRSGAEAAIVSSHKIGGPKGVGALLLRRGVEAPVLLRGGGQEMGRRAGTENVAGAAGFGAAAEAAARDLEADVWDRVEKLRNLLESALEHAVPEIIFVGKGSRRLPNTTCFAAPGWRAVTQVMRMDLAGFAVSAGSACSSGKVRASRTVRAMGFDEAAAESAVRASLGPTTTEAEASAFADAWTDCYRRFRAKAA